MRTALPIIFSILLSACNTPPAKEVSFYYWRTAYKPNEVEKETLAGNNVRTLYVRYFDVDLPSGSEGPQPVSPVRLDTSVDQYHIIPVVYIKNRVFQQLDTVGVASLAAKVFHLVSQINRSVSISPAEVQFDCDWTARTKENYFLFITKYKAISGKPVSATIRLHQVKYPSITGIPPVHRGVLMYYNMGEINAGPQNSIYEKQVAERYNSFIKDYPLQLDVALPIFSWGLKIRDGKVVELLNKIYFSHFENDSNFRMVNKERFVVKHACFKAGYYFAQNDEVKIENISKEDLQEMAKQVNRYSNHKIDKFIFYDLDSANIVQYEKDIFKKVSGNIH